MDIYFTLQKEEGANTYLKTVATLEKYFITKVNTPYERYKFRATKQEHSETVEQYVSRLRQKAIHCEFENTDEQIRDQVIEKCKSTKLRKKLLEKGQDLKLDELCRIACTMELADLQSKRMDEGTAAQDSGTVNKLENGEKPKRVETRNIRQPRNVNSKQQEMCFRCGLSGHKARDRNCPARNKKCDRCGLIGHYKKCCKTQMGKNAGKQSGRGRSGYVNKVT
ncbi:uncharacterized protein LOC128554499 [Mercenaria mercenaria]|uniref:uncharacterized protein LOC128554499 n=1 Tax=Mercenaria mercenaria TaxID=6596 RepID=UPI00234F881D|nr:uncharacterized protein LOC128554499 [Mercenaria mercenaria]